MRKTKSAKAAIIATTGLKMNNTINRATSKAPRTRPQKNLERRGVRRAGTRGRLQMPDLLKSKAICFSSF
ncbi:MAG: hypothetical protein ACOX7U_04775 [Desulfitobacteriia bacterium]